MSTTVLLIAALTASLVALVAVVVHYRRAINQLEQQLQATEREYEAELEELHRTYRNRIERLERELERTEREGHLDFASDLFTALDALEQALEARDTSTETGAELEEGLEMVRTSFHRALDQHGIEPVEPEVHDAFEPERHEALRAVDPAEAEPGTVVACHRPGYRFDDRLLRPASVDVAVGRDDSPADDADGPETNAGAADGETEAFDADAEAVEEASEGGHEETSGAMPPETDAEPGEEASESADVEGGAKAETEQVARETNERK